MNQGHENTLPRIKKILVVLPNWIGDAVMSVPAVSQIRERCPSARITIIGLPHISELFYESPYVDEILVYKKYSPFSKGGLTAAGFSLRSEKFDLALLLPNSFRSALLVRLAGIPLRCGYSRDARGFLLTMPIRLTPQIKRVHQVEYYLHLARSIEENRWDRAVLTFFASLNASTASKAKDASTASKTKNVTPICHENVIPAQAGIQNAGRGLDSHFRGNDRCVEGFSDEPTCPSGAQRSMKIPPPLTGGGEGEGERRVFSDENQGKMGALLFLSKGEIQLAKETLDKNQITPDDLLIGINPGATYGSSKRWHPERFRQVAAALIRKYHAKIILFGGPGESDIAEEIVRDSGPSLLNISGQTTIRGLMALISQCRVLITNDSGPMHIAAALRVPVVAIFGSTDPALTIPIGTGHVVIRKDVPCSPCFRRKCPTDLKCMDLIQVEDVLGGIEKILGQL